MPAVQALPAFARAPTCPTPARESSPKRRPNSFGREIDPGRTRSHNPVRKGAAIMNKQFVAAALLALALISGATALTGCLDPHDTHVETGVMSPR
jgi:hypothetical protein